MILGVDPSEEFRILNRLNGVSVDANNIGIMKEELLRVRNNMVNALIRQAYSGHMDKLKTDILKIDLMGLDADLSHEEAAAFLRVLWHVCKIYYDGKPLELYKACK